MPVPPRITPAFKKATNYFRLARATLSIPGSSSSFENREELTSWKSVYCATGNRCKRFWRKNSQLVLLNLPKRRAKGIGLRTNQKSNALIQRQNRDSTTPPSN